LQKINGIILKSIQMFKKGGRKKSMKKEDKSLGMTYQASLDALMPKV